MPRHNNLLKFVPFKAPTCNAKRQYVNENEAKKSAEYQMLINQDLELAVYKCDICQKWHLTRNKR